MCHERERLIDYAYDECGAEERRQIETHVATCDECRQEVADLKRVRRDLQSWELPPQPSLWTPFAPGRQDLWWRQVPAWALAAAASLALMLGAIGGAAVQTILRADQPAASDLVASTPAPPVAVEVPAAVDIVPASLTEVPEALIAERVAAAEARLRREFMAELEARLEAARQPERVQAAASAPPREVGLSRQEWLAWARAADRDIAHLNRVVTDIRQSGDFSGSSRIIPVSLSGDGR